jgi:hypothetical protein
VVADPAGPLATVSWSASVIEKGAVSRVVPLASVTRTTRLLVVPATKGVPEIVPELESERPNGRLPWAREKL